MTITQLECFLEVVKQGNFSLAAANLYMSQPTLSRNIQALEDELRTQLFIRANNTIHLSPVGEELKPRLEELYETFRNTSAQMQATVDRYEGQLKIGMLASLTVDGGMYDAFHAFREGYPDATLMLYHVRLREMYHLLMDGAIDALICPDVAMPPSEKVLSYKMTEDKMCLWVPKDHPNADRSSIEREDFNKMFPDLDLLVMGLQEFENPVRQDLADVYDGVLEKDQVTGISGDLADLDTMMLSVDAGLGMTPANENCVLKGNSYVRGIPITHDGIQDMININVYWIDKNESRHLKNFLHVLEEQDKKEAADYAE